MSSHQKKGGEGGEREDLSGETNNTELFSIRYF